MRRHLAAAEGQFNAVEWLVTRKHCNPSPVDRFGRTPLEVCGASPCWLLLHECCSTAQRGTIGAVLDPSLQAMEAMQASTHHNVLGITSWLGLNHLVSDVLVCVRALAQCAFIGKYLDIQKLLFSAGAKVYRKGIGLVECQIST